MNSINAGTSKFKCVAEAAVATAIAGWEDLYNNLWFDPEL
jgi:hypothetical protein